MSEFCHFTDIYSIGQMSEYVLFYGHLSHRLDVYRSDGVTPYSTRYLQVGPINPTTNPDKFEFCIWQHNSQKASCFFRPAGLRTVFEPEK